MRKQYSMNMCIYKLGDRSCFALDVMWHQVRYQYKSLKEATAHLLFSQRFDKLNHSFLTLQRVIISRTKYTVQRSPRSITLLFLVPHWSFGPCIAALHVANWSPKNVKLPTAVSVKLPVTAICLVYMCQQGILADKANQYSLNFVSYEISCDGQLFADVFTLIIPTRGMAFAPQRYYWTSK